MKGLSSVNKVEYLKHFITNEGYDSKGSLQSLITIQFEDPDSSELFKLEPFAAYIEKKKYWTLIDGQPVQLDGDVNEPFFYMDEILEIPGDFHPMLKGKAVKTTFGLLLFNVILIWEPFKGTVDYINREFTKGIFEDLFRDIMVDNPKEGETVPQGKASVDECLMFTHNCNFLEGLGTHYIKPGGLDALTVDPEVLALRDRLFKEHAHELNNPVVFTTIVEQVVALDMKKMLEGPSKKFFINKKFIDNSRKRMFIAFGIEPNDTGDGWVALTQSLDEGWDTKHLAAYINTAVAGSYSRSMATGEGGSQVKETLRLIGRAVVSMTTPDCGSPSTETVLIAPYNKKYWIGIYAVIKDAVTLITKENVDSLVGKPTKVRVTNRCILVDGEYCQTCCGLGLGAYGERLSSEIVLIPTRMMLQRMKAAHTAGSKTSVLDLEIALK